MSHAGGEVRWDDVRLVAGREVGEKLRSRAFLLSTLLFLGLVAASIALPALLFDDGPAEYDVAAVGPAAAALADAAPPDAVDLTVTAVDSREQADALVREEQVEAAVEVGPDGVVLTALHEAPGSLVDALSATVAAGELQAALEGGGAPPAEVERLLVPQPVDTRLLANSELDPAAVPVVLAAAVVAVRVGERLYRASLLRTRGKTSLADAWSGRTGGAS